MPEQEEDMVLTTLEISKKSNINPWFREFKTKPNARKFCLLTIHPKKPLECHRGIVVRIFLTLLTIIYLSLLNEIIHTR